MDRILAQNSLGKNSLGQNSLVHNSPQDKVALGHLLKKNSLNC